MLKIILSILISIITIFQAPAPLPKTPTPYLEECPVSDKLKIHEKINGVSGSEFYISRPAYENYQSVSSSEFGLSPENSDNTDALLSAIEYCKAHKGTRLIIEEGTYYFNQANKIIFEGVEDCFVDGSRARFIFTQAGTYIRISSCDTLELNGLTVDWDRENDPIEDICRVVATDEKNHTVDLEFFIRDKVNPNMRFHAITQCDAENNYTFGAKGSAKECYFYMTEGSVQKVEQLSDNTLRVTHNSCLDNFEVNETYILRHYVYDGEAFGICNNAKNITIDNVKLYGSTGAGFAICDGASHFQIINSVIGVDPKLSDKHFVSLGADGIHIVNTGGCFRLENCDISRQGDDALNVHDGLGYIESVDKNKVKMYASRFRMEQGDTLKFKDNGFNTLDFEAVITSADTSNVLKEVTFDRDVSSAIKSGYIAFNTACNSGNYVIRNNYIHENRARGLLLQSDNGLCEGNRFYKTEMQAIKIVMDIIPSLWQEGTGVDSLVIGNNSFEDCDIIKTGEVINIGTAINGEEANCEPFTNIAITQNTFSDFPDKLMLINNVNGLVISENKIKVNSSKNNLYFGEYVDNVEIANNEWSGNDAKLAKIVKAKKFSDAVLLNRNTEIFTKY